MSKNPEKEISTKKKTGPKGPSKYTPAKIENLVQELQEYADQKREEGKPILIVGFCAEKRVGRSYLLELCDKNSPRFKPELSEALKQFKEIQEFDIAEGALTQRYDSGFAFKALKNVSEWRDEQHLKSEHTERKVILIRNETALRLEQEKQLAS